MKIDKQIVLVGVLSCALVPEPADAETIEVYSCDPGDIELGTGPDMICLDTPDWIDSGPPDPVDGRDDLDPDQYGKPSGVGKDKDKGKGKGKGKGGGGGVGRHKAICRACKSAKNKCISQAQLAETSCMDDARDMVAFRCDIAGRKGNTITPWGCSIFDLYNQECPGVESPWNDKDKWEPGGLNTQWNCQESWRVPHPGGTVSASSNGQYSATFGGVGGSTSKTLTTTYELTGQHGYGLACVEVGNSLAGGCTGEASKCYMENDCTAEDL